MIRVTNQYMTNNLIRNLNSQNRHLDKIQNKISTLNKLHLPSENPNSMSLLMSYRSNINEYTRYESNIKEGNDRLNFIDTKLQEINSYLQEIREQAIKGANGILTNSDRENIAIQVEQYLRQIVQVANSKFKGESLFSGHQSNSESYNLSFSKIPNWGNPLISKVDYKGDIGNVYREIDRGEYLEVNLPGNRAFWASNQRINSQTVATGYIAHNSNQNLNHQIIKIDGANIRIDNGDNLQNIVNKINNANIAVQAEIDNTSGEDLLVLQTTKPHQIMLEDKQGGKILQDLGLIVTGGSKAPNNYAPSALVYGDSLFNKIINLRNALFKNDVNEINKELGGIDEAMNNLTSHMSLIGSRQSRLDLAQKIISKSIIYANEAYSKIQATNLPKAITEMKNIKLSHEAALQIGSQIIRPTLLEFLR